MKRINKFLNMILFSILSLSMAFGFVLNSIQLPTRKLDAATSTSSKVYTTDYYTLSYSNNEVKLLLNSDLRVYQNFSKQDLKDLKDAIISVGYTAILDDIDFTTDQPSVKKRAVSPKIGENVDVSLIQDIIANQLINFETIDNALDINGTYDTLIEYYVDRYVDVFIEANPTSNVENVFAEVKEQLTISIQETVNHVYEQAGALDNAPNVSNKIHSLVQNVEDLKANDQKVEISLNDLTDIFKTIDNTTTIVEIVNDLQLATEVKDVIKNSESEEIVNFFVSVDTSTITNVFQNVKLDNVELKEIVSSVGVDNIIEIVDTIGMDNVIEIAKSANLTKDDLQEIIKNNVSDISIASLIKSIESISINGNPIFANDEFKMSGLEALIKSLPRPSEIANLSDEEMQFSWNLDVVTIFGEVEFDLTVGFMGDCSLIRSAAREIAEIFDVNIQDGVYNIGVKIPEKLTNALLKICNSDQVPDRFKHSVFDNAFLTVEEIYTKITNKSLDEYIEYLKQFDYQHILENLYNADNLNKLFGTDKFSDERLDKFVDEVCNLVSKAATLSYDQIKNFVSRYVNLSLLDNAKVEELVNKTIQLLKKIDSLSLDSQLLRKFIDPNSPYTNENIYNYLDKLASYEGYFNRIMEYFAKVYEAVPNRLKDNTILDYYKGNGSFNYTGTLNLNFEKICNTISSTYGPKIYDALSLMFDRLPSQMNVSISLSMKNVYKVTYNIGNTKKEGVLPAGADVNFFANQTSIDGYTINRWVDKDGIEYKTMPAKDVELFAITEFIVSINEGINKVYDGKEYILEATGSPSNEYSYQWYKDGKLIPGATQSTYAVVNVADSGMYYCEVSLPTFVAKTDEVEVVITKATIDVSEVEWNYYEADPIPYDGNEKEVGLKEETIPAGVTAIITGNKGTNAGNYTANVSFEYDEANYELVGNVGPLTWTIAKAKIDVSQVEWDYEKAFTYDGSEKEVGLKEETIPAGVTPVLTGNKGTNVGTYTAVVAFSFDSENYEIVGNVAPLTWEIVNATISTTDKKTYEENDVVIVEITSPSSVIESTSEIKCSDATNNTKDVDLSSIIEEGQTAQIGKTYDISFVDKNGNTQNYQDDFTVRLLIPEELLNEENLKVIYISDDNKTVTEIEATRQGNYMVFKTNHFSQYAIVAVSQKTAPATDSKDINWLMILILILILILLVLVIINGRKGKTSPTTVTENNTEKTYLVKKDNEITQEKLSEILDKDAINPKDMNAIALGTINENEIRLFKHPLPIMEVCGKINHKENGDVVINVFKSPAKVVIKPNSEKIIIVHELENGELEKMEVGSIHKNDKEIKISIYKTPKKLDK